MKHVLKIIIAVTVLFTIVFIAGCHQSPENTQQENKNNDSVIAVTTTQPSDTLLSSDTTKTKKEQSKQKNETPSVTIYNFHLTKRCPSCIAIEEATTKTIDTYFSKEYKQGRIKRFVLNLDDKENNEISEKYQIFGAGIVVSRIYKGKETFTDLTGSGFKYAKNKEEKFIEILKSQIDEYLK